MRSNDRILTTHVGSLPRPDDLLALYAWAKLPVLVEGAELASTRLRG